MHSIKKVTQKALDLLRHTTKFLYSILNDYRWLIVFYTGVQFFMIFRRDPYALHLHVITSLPLCYIISYTFCLIGRLLRLIVGRLWGACIENGWHILCHIFVYAIAILDLYLLKAFGLTFGHNTIQLLLQTNTNETKEFFATYIFSPTTLFVLSVFLVIGLCEYIAFKKLKAYNPLNIKPLRYILIAYLIWGLRICILVFSIFNAPSAGAGFEIGYNSVFDRIHLHNYVRLGEAIRIAYENKDTAGKLRPNIDDTRVLSQTKYNGNIILVIGESHIKHHASLYGYSKPTNPKLESIKNELLLFDDVISLQNSTATVFREMLSVSSLDDEKLWYEVTLFPAVFKRAGWNVILCTNQFTDVPCYDPWNAAIQSYLNDKYISNACFTTRNHTTYDYDDQMVDSFITHRHEQIEPCKPTLSIIQLTGQHVAYKGRCPEHRKVFSISDYADRKELTTREKQFVADYDNATRFNDEQIYKLIQAIKDEDAVLIYFSDHGDEVNDYRSHVGRAHDLAQNAPISYHYQIDIPFIVYMTAKYKEAHPQYANLFEQAVKRPFMNDDISHLLFYIGEVDTEWFDPSRCLIHPDYNTKRQRILENGDNYDQLSR